jgi:hypothetical protein
VSNGCLIGFRFVDFQLIYISREYGLRIPFL